MLEQLGNTDGGKDGQVWFQNRRAKYRKQEKQLVKQLQSQHHSHHLHPHHPHHQPNFQPTHYPSHTYPLPSTPSHIGPTSPFHGLIVNTTLNANTNSTTIANNPNNTNSNHNTNDLALPYNFYANTLSSAGLFHPSYAPMSPFPANYPAPVPPLQSPALKQPCISTELSQVGTATSNAYMPTEDPGKEVPEPGPTIASSTNAGGQSMELRRGEAFLSDLSSVAAVAAAACAVGIYPYQANPRKLPDLSELEPTSPKPVGDDEKAGFKLTANRSCSPDLKMDPRMGLIGTSENGRDFSTKEAAQSSASVQLAAVAAAMCHQHSAAGLVGRDSWPDPYAKPSCRVDKTSADTGFRAGPIMATSKNDDPALWNNSTEVNGSHSTKESLGPIRSQVHALLTSSNHPFSEHGSAYRVDALPNKPSHDLRSYPHVLNSLSERCTGYSFQTTPPFWMPRAQQPMPPGAPGCRRQPGPIATLYNTSNDLDSARFDPRLLDPNCPNGLIDNGYGLLRSDPSPAMPSGYNMTQELIRFGSRPKLTSCGPFNRQTLLHPSDELDQSANGAALGRGGSADDRVNGWGLSVVSENYTVTN